MKKTELKKHNKQTVELRRTRRTQINNGQSVEEVVDCTKKVFEKLFKEHSIIKTKDVFGGFEQFKTSYLNKLEFLNQQMIEIYQMAYFYKFYNLKISKEKFCGKKNLNMFSNALNEIKIEPVAIHDEPQFICNLYSILHPL